MQISHAQLDEKAPCTEVHTQDHMPAPQIEEVYLIQHIAQPYHRMSDQATSLEMHDGTKFITPVCSMHFTHQAHGQAHYQSDFACPCELEWGPDDTRHGS